MRIVVGITGASGACLGVRLVETLKAHEVALIVSHDAWRIMDLEIGSRPEFPGVQVFGGQDFSAPMASGSDVFDAMVVVPCSMKTLAGIAHGYSDTLIIRAADNALRLGRRLVLVPRETPLSLASLENLVAVRRAGAIVLPPVLAFYHRPRRIEDMVDYVVGKVLDALGIPNDLYDRWNA